MNGIRYLTKRKPISHCRFSLALKHKKTEELKLWNPKFYEKDIMFNEKEFFRSPFYEFARQDKMTPEEAKTFVDDLQSGRYIDFFPVLKDHDPTPEVIAYQRYADMRFQDQDLDARRIFIFPRGKPYERKTADHLFRVQKPNNHLQIIARRMPFLPELFPPFQVHNERLIYLFDQYKKLANASFADSEAAKPEESNSEAEERKAHMKEIEEEMREIIESKLNYDELPIVALALAFEVRLNNFSVWRAVENACLENLNLFSITQICQIEAASRELKPKRFSTRLSDLIYKQMNDAMPFASAHELLLVLQGFRKREKKELWDTIMRYFVDRKQELMGSNGEGREFAENCVNVVYTLAASQPRNYSLKKYHHRKDIDELLAHYEDDLCDHAHMLDAEYNSRLATALYLFKSQQYDPIWWRVETNAVRDKNKLDSHQLTSILRSFSKGGENTMYGKDRTFVELEPRVLELLDSNDEHKRLSMRDASHAMFTYAARGGGNPELHVAFQNRLRKEAEQLDYPGIHNVLYYLMMRDVVDRDLWQRCVDAAVANEDVLPLIHLRPFRMAWYYLQHHHADMDLIDFQDKFWYAERYYNATAIESEFMKKEEYRNFKGFLNGHLLVYPVPFVILNNIFVIHFALYKQKIGFNYYPRDRTMRETQRVSELQKLHGKLLGYQGWEIMEMGGYEFEDMTFQERDMFFREWLREAKERQIKKGIMPRVPPKYP